MNTSQQLNLLLAHLALSSVSTEIVQSLSDSPTADATLWPYKFALRANQGFRHPDPLGVHSTSSQIQTTHVCVLPKTLDVLDKLQTVFLDSPVIVEGNSTIRVLLENISNQDLWSVFLTSGLPPRMAIFIALE